MSDSTETARPRRWFPESSREAVFIVASMVGVLTFAIGMLNLILGLSLGYRSGGFLSPVVRSVLALVGISLIIEHVTARIRAYEGLPVEGRVRSRLAGSVVLVPVLVGLVVGCVAIIVGLPSALPVPATESGSPLTFVGGAALGLVVAAAVGLLAFGLKAAGTRLTELLVPHSRGALRAITLVFGHRWTRNPQRDAACTEVRRSGRAWLVYVGAVLLFLGVSAETTVSAPFLTTPSDKYVLVGGGVLLMWAGVDVVRLAGRVIGW